MALSTNKNKLIPISAKEVDELANYADTKSLLPALMTKPYPTKQFTSTVRFITILRICLVLFVAFAFCFFSYTYSHRLIKTTLQAQKPVVLLISLDGFRFGYQFKAHTPNINRLIKNGVEAEDGLISVFPTLTFPNHYSIATGLYPAYHGIVNNFFSDPITGISFKKNSTDPKWWLGETLWETVTKHGLKASTYFWPGSQVHKGSWDCPKDYCMAYNENEPFEKRVDTVLGYFDTDNIPSLMTLYFEEPDKQGHKYGPDDDQIFEAVARMDKVIGRLIKGLKDRRVYKDVNILLVGDHGMARTYDDKIIYLNHLAQWIVIPKSWVESYGALVSIRPKNTSISNKDIVSKLNEGLMSRYSNDPYLKFYLKEDLPTRLHYLDSDRIAPIIGMVDEGFRVRVEESKKREYGIHGYDNEFSSMRSIFIAHGPRFARGRKVGSFENVEIYNIVTKLLNIPGAPNNGTSSFPDTIISPSN